MKLRIATLLALSLIAASFACAAAPRVDIRDGAERPSILKRPAILLFWADWCAPCRNEVRLLPDLAAAAAPLPVIVVPVDASPQTRYLLKGVATDQIAYVVSGGRSLLDALAHDPAGLPVAVAVDASGAACAVKLGALLSAEAKAWAAHCGLATVP